MYTGLLEWNLRIYLHQVEANPVQMSLKGFCSAAATNSKLDYYLPQSASGSPLTNHDILLTGNSFLTFLVTRIKRYSQRLVWRTKG